MQNTLEKIRKLLLPKENFSVVVYSNTTDWTTSFSPSLYLNPERQYELALVNLETYYGIPNITAETNAFVYSPDNGKTWETIKLPDGTYELKQINDEIQRQMKVKGHWNAGTTSHYITLGANNATLRTFVEISAPYQVDMAKSTLRTLLGFKKQKLTSGYREGENPVDIMPVSSILVNCDLVSGSFLNGVQSPVVYSFFPNESPGEKIVASPKNLVYMPISQAGSVQSLRVWLTDQTGKQLNLRGETITIRFHIKAL